MSQIKLLHSGGNGVSIVAPDSNPASDRTLKLPGDGDGTILTTNSSVGKILQVVQTVKKDTFSFTTTASTISTSGDVTGLNVTITPSNASNKILLIPSIVVSHDAVFVYLYKDGSLIDQIGNAGNDGDGNALIRSTFGAVSNSMNCSTTTGLLLDTAGGTSAITYSIRLGAMWIGSSTKTLFLNKTGRTNEVYSSTYRLGRYISTFTAIEIAA